MFNENLLCSCVCLTSSEIRLQLTKYHIIRHSASYRLEELLNKTQIIRAFKQFQLASLTFKYVSSAHTKKRAQIPRFKSSTALRTSFISKDGIEMKKKNYRRQSKKIQRLLFMFSNTFTTNTTTILSSAFILKDSIQAAASEMIFRPFSPA